MESRRSVRFNLDSIYGKTKSSDDFHGSYGPLDDFEHSLQVNRTSFEEKFEAILKPTWKPGPSVESETTASLVAVPSLEASPQKRRLVYPPMRSFAALSSPAVKGMEMSTEPSRELAILAELMFSIKISRLPTVAFEDIFKDAVRSEHVVAGGFLDVPVRGLYEYSLFAEDVFLKSFTGASESVAEDGAFESFVSKVVKSDYLILATPSHGRLELNLFESYESAPKGAYRYDLLCRRRLVPLHLLPVCRSCDELGHTEHFCPLSPNTNQPKGVENQTLSVDSSMSICSTLSNHVVVCEKDEPSQEIPSRANNSNAPRSGILRKSNLGPQNTTLSRLTESVKVSEKGRQIGDRLSTLSRYNSSRYERKKL